MNFLVKAASASLVAMSIASVAHADSSIDGKPLAFTVKQSKIASNVSATKKSPLVNSYKHHHLTARRHGVRKLARARGKVGGGKVASYRQMIAAHARANGVPFALANAVVRVESSYNPHALSGGNYGLMQIRPQTARGLGYRGPASGLLNAETNLRYGVKYLAIAYHHAHGDTCRALMGYQSGVFARHMSSANHRYCHKALVYMAQS